MNPRETMIDPLDPLLLVEITKRAKKQLRRRAKEMREKFPRAALARRSDAIAEQLAKLPEIQSARGVALFYPMVERGEIDLRSLDASLRARGVTVYYPFMAPRAGGGFSTGFQPTAALSELEERGRGFLEPPRDAPIAQPGDVDLVVVPALAADGRGHRLGYGAGFYDATLGDVAPPARTAIVVYSFQLLAEIPSEVHDVPCDLVVTDKQVLRPNRPDEP